MAGQGTLVWIREHQSHGNDTFLGILTGIRSSGLVKQPQIWASCPPTLVSLLGPSSGHFQLFLLSCLGWDGMGQGRSGVKLGKWFHRPPT